MVCTQCGTNNQSNAVFCTHCGNMDFQPAATPQYSPTPPPQYQPGMNLQAAYQPPPQTQPVYVQVPVLINSKSKIAAALLAFFLGGLGIHRFYLGYTGLGIAQLSLFLAGFITCGATWVALGIWVFIEFIMILVGGISKDAAGNPLSN